MAHFNVAGAPVVLSFLITGTLATGNVQATQEIPWDFLIEGISMQLDAKGTKNSTNVNTEVMIQYSASGGSRANIMAANTLQLEGTSTSDLLHAYTGRGNLLSTGTQVLADGGQLSIDLDEVPDTASKGLLVQIFGIGA